MDRRSFNKLIAGAVTAAGVPMVHAEGAPQPPVRALPSENKIPLEHREQSLTDVPAAGGSSNWELVILDGAPPFMQDIGGTAAADIDGDGKTEVIISGAGALLWYRPSTSERGVIAQGRFGVGLALADIDRDGHKEIIATEKINKPGELPEKWAISWHKFDRTVDGSWTSHLVDDETAGNPHDVVLGDLDGDGELEIVANAMYSTTPGTYAYKVPANPAGRWKKQVIQTGLSAEGTATGDLNKDGKDEVVSGPYWFSAPREGAFSGKPWTTHSLAPGFREMCRAVIIDVNQDGRLDVVLVEDEYPDGRLSWFENRVGPASSIQWIEHPIQGALNFPHTLRGWHDSETKQVCLLAGEMNEGGWAAPYNWDARLIRFTTPDRGQSWTDELIYQGEGSHEAVYTELDRSGEHVIFGHAAQVMAKDGAYTGWVQMFRPRSKPSKLAEFKHTFVDREKPYTGIDIHAADLDGDGHAEIICGAWWYKNPDWQRHQVPGIGQIIAAFDVDKDGHPELIAIKAKPGADGFYPALTSELVWLKPTDLNNDRWEEYSIGAGDGDWPHGVTIAPLLPGGRAALVCGYHNGKERPPQIFEVPDDPKQPWPKRILADIRYGEQMLPFDLDGDGKLDIVAGPYWLENLGDGRFEPHLLIDPEYLETANLKMICRIALADLNGDGRTDILFSVEDVDYKVRKAFFAPVGWLENTGNLHNGSFKLHIIDRIRSPHSLSVADLDGDGELEVVVGEHDPFTPYRSKARLYAYKKTDAKGISWSRFPIDNRFSNHVGAKSVELSPGRLVILSHSWFESSYVHLWEQPKA
jgi:hypothetical protein